MGGGGGGGLGMPNEEDAPNEKAICKSLRERIFSYLVVNNVSNFKLPFSAEILGINGLIFHEIKQTARKLQHFYLFVQYCYVCYYQTENPDNNLNYRYIYTRANYGKSRNKIAFK